MNSSELKVKIYEYFAEKKNYSQQDIDKYLKPLEFEFFDDKLSILAPHKLFYSYLKDDLKKDLLFFLQNLTELNINFASNNIIQNSNKINLQTTKNKFNFENYFFNKKNSFAVEVLKKIHSIENNHSIIVIHGGSGVGKTHLLTALSNELTINKNSFFFGNVDDFYSLYSKYLANDFYYHISKYEFIIIDDIHKLNIYDELCNKFYLILEYCLKNNIKLIFSINEAPVNWNILPKDVKNNLEQGLILFLKEADFDIKLQYIKNKCKNEQIILDKAQILTIAQKSSSLRRIDGLFQRLIALQGILELDYNKIRIEDAIKYSADYKKNTPQEIISIVATRLNISIKDIIGKKRDAKIVLSRDIAIFLCRELLGISYLVIGNYFGGRNYSSILHAYKKVKKLQEDNKDMNNMIEELSLLCKTRF